jgi:hypothetical protein
MSTTNPDPGKYRIAEVCIGGGETGYLALLPRRRSWLRALRARRRGLHDYEVQPIMTREMLDAVVASSDDELQMRWDGDEVVVTDISDEQPVGNTMVAVEIAEGDRPSERIRPDRNGLYEVASFSWVGNVGWGWTEIIPPWPSGHVDAEMILDLLAADSPDIRPIQDRVKARADIREIAAALRMTSDTSLRKTLCYLLYLREPGDSALALPALLPLLQDPDSGVRAQAAEAIFGIGHGEGHESALAAAPEAGKVLFAALAAETDDWAKAMIVSAIGQVHYEPAVQTLIALLPHDHEQIRRSAARSLGALRATDAAPALRTALEHETDKYAAERMQEALAAIEVR